MSLVVRLVPVPIDLMDYQYLLIITLKSNKVFEYKKGLFQFKTITVRKKTKLKKI